MLCCAGPFLQYGIPVVEVSSFTPSPHPHSLHANLSPPLVLCDTRHRLCRYHRRNALREAQQRHHRCSRAREWKSDRVHVWLRLTPFRDGHIPHRQGSYLLRFIMHEPSSESVNSSPQLIHERFGERTASVEMFVQLKGSFSGGTLATGIMMEENPELFAQLKVWR